MTDAKNVREQAAEFYANPQFSQSIIIPAAENHAELTISYASYGHNEEERGSVDGDGHRRQAPVALLMPGMFGSRYLGYLMHFFAKKHRVRVLMIDRFGFGSTTIVPLEKRVELWVTIVPKLLDALGIEHVALISHSAGTIYSLNTLWHCRRFLHPEHPQVFFFAPFVDPAHSDAPLMVALKALPSFAINYWNKVSGFVAVRATGAIDASSGLVSKMFEALLPRSTKPPAEQDGDSPQRILEQEYGLGADLQIELNKLAVKKMFGESTVGVNDEATLCLKRGPAGSWGEAEDASALVKKMAMREKESRRNAVTEQEGKLSIKIYFAESDVMTGKAGQRFFESCWKGQDGEHDDCFDLEVQTLQGCDHDGVLMQVAILKKVFGVIGNA